MQTCFAPKDPAHPHVTPSKDMHTCYPQSLQSSQQTDSSTLSRAILGPAENPPTAARETSSLRPWRGMHLDKNLQWARALLAQSRPWSSPSQKFLSPESAQHGLAECMFLNTSAGQHAPTAESLTLFPLVFPSSPLWSTCSDWSSKQTDTCIGRADECAAFPKPQGHM